jgi:hypothetical protein
VLARANRLSGMIEVAVSLERGGHEGLVSSSLRPLNVRIHAEVLAEFAREGTYSVDRSQVNHARALVRRYWPGSSHCHSHDCQKTLVFVFRPTSHDRMEGYLFVF